MNTAIVSEKPFGRNEIFSIESTDVYSVGDATTAERAVIMMHGRGAIAPDFLQLYSLFDVPSTLFIAPQAPNGTWYPHSFLAPESTNQPSLRLSLAMLDACVENILDKGFPSNKITLMGFSQGACLTLEYAARHAKRYSAVVAFTGGLIGETIDVSNYKGDFEKTSIFIGSGDNDPHVPLERIDESEEILKSFGASVIKQIYPDSGHTIRKKEIAFASMLMRSQLVQ